MAAHWLPCGDMRFDTQAPDGAAERDEFSVVQTQRSLHERNGTGCASDCCVRVRACRTAVYAPDCCVRARLLCARRTAVCAYHSTRWGEQTRQTSVFPRVLRQTVANAAGNQKMS